MEDLPSFHQKPPTDLKPRRFTRSCAILTTLVMLISIAFTVFLATRHALAQDIQRTDTSVGIQPFTFSTPPIRLGILSNFPDPAVFYDRPSATWYLYGTNPYAGILPPHASMATNTTPPTLSDPVNVQLASTSNFKNWVQHPTDPLPVLGAWVHNSTNPASNTTFNGFANVWAPDVLQHPTTPHNYLLYYSATSADHPNSHCLGSATSTNPQGPFTPEPSALACPASVGGAIDAVAFIDTPDPANTTDSTIYLVYKVDQNSRGHGGACSNSVEPRLDTPLVLQRLTPNGTAADPALPPLTILDRTDEDGDGPLIEAPSLVKVQDLYYLFYSSGCTRDDSYDVKYATSAHVSGPYERRGALLRTGDYGLRAPGSVSVKIGCGERVGGVSGVSGDEWIMALHARVGTAIGGLRAVFTTGLKFDMTGGVELVDVTGC